MKVKDVLALAAENLGREELAARVRDCATPSGELSSLLRCYHLVENEIALDYFPLIRTEVFLPEDGKICFERFCFSPVEVLGVYGSSHQTLAFQVSPCCVSVEGACGEVAVKYRYSPAEKDWNAECTISPKVSARLLSFGVASEFCLSNGQYAEAAAWEKKYREALRCADLPRRRLVVKSRRWA